MKRIFFTYRVQNKPSDKLPHNIETTQTCITLPMRDEVGHDILKKGNNSPYLCSKGEVRIILEQISELQGYSFDSVVEIEEV